MSEDTLREQGNLLRAVRFERPDYIPMRVAVMSACWEHYPQGALQELMAAHPLLFPHFSPSATLIKPHYEPWRRAGEPHTDSWGCVWETNANGFTGAVVKRPFVSWEEAAAYTPPDPGKHSGWGPIDWQQVTAGFASARSEGRLAQGSLRHGHTFLTLSYIRGYENLLFDMVDARPELVQLIEMVEGFNAALVHRFVQIGANWLGYPEDLGTQNGPLLSPALFRRYIKPVYARLIAPAREAGCVIHMHSDGDIRLLAEDLLECGVQVLNCQDLVNGISWLKQNLKGRVCIHLDVDRQKVLRFGTPTEVDALIRREVAELGSRDGGLMMIHDLVPGIPLENIKALMDAMERYASYYA